VARTNPPTSNLRLYTEPLPPRAAPPTPAIGSLPDVLAAFRRATGWSLQYHPGAEPKAAADVNWSVPVKPGAGAAVGHLSLGPPPSAPGGKAVTSAAGNPPTKDSGKGSSATWESARGLASALAGMLEELTRFRTALWEREAELAAGVPLVPHRQQKEHLALRLEAVLQGGARALGCHAAALYLLDAGTSKLKLRSCWGLPMDRLTAPPRPLQGAVADLEALVGHAVVLSDAQGMRYWNVPEDFAAAACVPVASPTTILGTLWVFANNRRDFNDHETNILEVLAGRVAADLEREMLWHEATAAAELKSQALAAERLQRNQLPTIAPLLDDWDLAGWTAQAGPLGGDFHDWFCLPDGLLAVAVGHAMDRGLEAALAAGALKAALRAHGHYHREAQPTLKRLNLTLWTGSAGDQHASLFYGLIETATGRVCCASAGQPGAILVRPDGWQPVAQTSARLGEGPESHFEPLACQLQPGEALVLFSEGVGKAADGNGQPLGDSGVADSVVGQLDLSAADLLARIRQRLESSTREGETRDRTVLVVKRRPRLTGRSCQIN
jgi:serine phosphatase RsbU (regulator of sigma subunit)